MFNGLVIHYPKPYSAQSVTYVKLVSFLRLISLGGGGGGEGMSLVGEECCHTITTCNDLFQFDFVMYKVSFDVDTCIQTHGLLVL